CKTDAWTPIRGITVVAKRFAHGTDKSGDVQTVDGLRVYEGAQALCSKCRIHICHVMESIFGSTHQIPAQSEVCGQVSGEFVVILYVSRVIVEQESMIRHSTGVKGVSRDSQQEGLEAVEAYQSVEVLRKVTIHTSVGVKTSETEEMLPQRIA